MAVNYEKEYIQQQQIPIYFPFYLYNYQVSRNLVLVMLMNNNILCQIVCN